MSIAILLPAAGASSRMGGRDKLLEMVEGQPLLRRQALRALATGADVIVTTRADRPGRAKALEETGVHLVEVADPSEGIAASLRAGLTALPQSASALIVLLPDLPEIDTSDLQTLIAAHQRKPERILRASSRNGTAGHPTLFPSAFWPSLAHVTGDAGAAALIRAAGFDAVPLQGDRAITDLDTPEAWTEWRARNNFD